jgi:WD40 repeat protein
VRKPQWLDFRDPALFSARVDDLVRALDTDADWVGQHTRLLIRANEWARRDRDASLLLRGRDLTEAERWLARQPGKEPVPTPLQAEYVAAGRRAAARRQRVTMGAVLLALAVAVGLAILAFVERSEAIAQSKASGSRALAASAVAELPRDPELSLLLAREAADREETDEAEQALRAAITQSHVRRVLRVADTELEQARFSPDGELVAGIAADGSAHIWNAETGAEVSVLHGSAEEIKDVAVAPGGQLVATAAGRRATVLELGGGRPVARLEHPRAIVSMAFDGSGKRVLTAARDGKARIWDARSGRLLHALARHRGPLSGAAFTADDRLVVTTGSDRSAGIWSAPTGRLLQVVRPEFDTILDEQPSIEESALSGNGRRLALVDDLGEVTVWDTRSGRRVARVGGLDSHFALVAALNRRGTRLATGDVDGNARIWQIPSGEVAAELRGHGDQITDAAFSPDDSLVVTASVDGTARTWRVETGDEEVRTGEEVAALRGHGRRVLSAEFARSGDSLLTVGADGTARLWDAGAQRSVARLGRHSEWVRDAAFSPDGTLVASASDDAVAEIWHVGDWKRVARLDRHEEGVRTLDFTNDGKLLVTAGADATGWLWDARTGRAVAPLRGHHDNIDHVEFSKDGSLAVTASGDGTARVWDTADGEGRAVLRGHEDWVYDAAFSPDGKLVVTAGGDDSARIWDVESGRTRHVLEHDSEVWDGEFSPDGKLVLTASADHPVALWDVASGRRVQALLRGGAGVGLAPAAAEAHFSPDGSQFVAVGLDEVARVFTTATGQIVSELRGHRDGVNDAAFSPDGRLVATAGQDNTARVWDAAAGTELMRMYVAGSAERASFNPAGDLIVTAGQSGSAQVFACPVCGSIDDLATIAGERRTRELTDEERDKYLQE